MKTLKRRPAACVTVLLAAILLAPAAPAAVATRRLSTGLSASAAAARLPEAWVAPAEAAPRLDGRLEEKAWSATRPVILGKLENRAQATPRTEVRLIHHRRTLYVGVQLAEPQLDKLKRTATKPDGPAYQDDSVELFLSPDPSQGYFQIILSASGAIYDRHGHGNPAHWNSGATAAVAVGAGGWSLEVAVPMAALGVGEQLPTRWRANVYRNRRAGQRSESQAFSPTLRSDYDVPERFGWLLFTPTSPWAEQETALGGRSGIDVHRLDGGGAVLQFDLSFLPKGTGVYRARLACERRDGDPADPAPPGAVEIYPLAAAYEKGKLPKTAGKPLALLGPWYGSLEITEPVRAWAARGEPHPGVYVKKLPGWLVHRTFLDVMFEGEPDGVPEQVTGLRALHRSGQTFLTWREISDPVGRDGIRWAAMKAILRDLQRRRELRYCVYRHHKPITPANIHQAEQIAVVEPLSGWNLNGRNIARPIDEFIATTKVLDFHQWNPFRGASLDEDFGRDCPIDRFVIAEGKPPLARGTGLYVHTATKSARACYAVVTRVDGVENTVDLHPGNSLTGAVAESVAEPEPVLQGELPKMPFFNYRQRRLHYVRWVAPPYANRPYAYYNWSVGVPERPDKSVPLELNLHRDGYAYWRTHYRIEPGSIVLCPHDFPLKTWWFGHHEAQGTLRPWAGGVIRNYTERRLLWFVDWAARKWPVDRNRILVTGCNGGASGSGALHLALRYPGVFNMVIAGHGEADYAAPGEQLEQLQRIWGAAAWKLKTETGRSVWDELDLLRTVRETKPAAELPFVAMTYSGRQQSPASLVDALSAAGRPVITHTAWGGARMIPVSATATNARVRLDVRKNLSMLGVNAAGKVGDAIRNGSLLWDSAELVDRPDRYAVTLRQASGGFQGTITLRRLQKFRVQAGKSYAWKLDPLETAGRDARNTPQTQQGTLTVGSDALLTIRDAKLATGGYRLTITPE